MAKNNASNKTDPEIAAISAVCAALAKIDKDAQLRVLRYAEVKFSIARSAQGADYSREDDNREPKETGGRKEVVAEDDESAEGGPDGISPVAKRWIVRNGLDAQRLSSVFSLGVDEIDLVAKKVPGKNKKERMHSVFLLKGIAAYLSTGAARFSHEQLKEACLHYDAFDATNFAVNLKSLAGEVSGTKDSGYALTPRGLANATEMVKELTKSS